MTSPTVTVERKTSAMPSYGVLSSAHFVLAMAVEELPSPPSFDKSPREIPYAAGSIERSPPLENAPAIILFVTGIIASR